MKLTIEPTDRIQTVDGSPCRIWKGTTEKDVPVEVYVRTISPQTHDETALADFDRELMALPAPRKEMVSYDLRLFMPDDDDGPDDDQWDDETEEEDTW